MPVYLDDGQVLLTASEQEDYRAAAALLAEVDDQVIDLRSPMTQGDLVDLITAYYVVLNDEEALQQMTDLFEAEVARRRAN